MFTNKKVLVLATTDNMIWQFLLPHIKQLQSMGNEVECACNRSGFWFDELQKLGLIVHEIPFKRTPLNFQNLKAYKLLKKLFKDRKYTLIHCCQPVGGVMGRLLGKKFKKPVIYTAHGFHFYKGAPLLNKIVYKNVEKYFAKYTDVLITMNQEDFEVAQKFKAKKVYKINGIGVNWKRFENIDKTFDREEFRKSLGFSAEDKIILTVAEHTENKNYKTILQVIKDLPHNYKFVSCGVGKLFEQNKEDANLLNLNDRVKFLGYRKDVNLIMKASDLFLFASFREGLPLAMQEAMYFGLPVVCSNIRGNRDLIEQGKGGFLVNEITNYKLYATAVEEIFERGLEKKMGEHNSNKIKEYSIENVLTQMKKIYEENFNAR